MLPPSAAASTASMWAELRHAEPADVPFLRRMIYQMTEFEQQPHIFSATDSSLLSTLFTSPPLPPFVSFTPLLLYLSFTSPHLPSQKTLSITRLSFPSPVTDPDQADFVSPLGDSCIVAGFVICFPNYPSFLGKPGLYIEDIFVREAWRRKGLGKFMLSAVAKKAAEMGMALVEWHVLESNVSAIEFYKGMGAEVLQEWRICRLTGPSLEKYKTE